MGLAVAVLAGHAEYSGASDYGYAGGWQGGQQSQAGQQNGYSTRWARETKPWSRDMSGAGRFDGNENGYSTGYGSQWEGESFGERNWQTAESPYGADSSWQSDGQNAPQQPSEEDNPWGSLQNRTAPSPGTDDPRTGRDAWRESDPWDDSRQGGASWSKGGRSQDGRANRTPNTYGETSWDGWSQPADKRSQGDYSRRGGASPEKPGWGSRSRDARRDAKTRAPGTGSYENPGDWERRREEREAGRAWGEHRRPDVSVPGRRPEPYSYDSTSPGAAPPIYSQNPGYSEYTAPYPGGLGYDSALVPGYGYGREIYGPEYTHGLGGQYPGLWNVPTVGELPWLPY